MADDTKTSLVYVLTFDPLGYKTNSEIFWQSVTDINCLVTKKESSQQNVSKFEKATKSSNSMVKRGNRKKKDLEKRTVYLHQCFQNLMEGTNFSKVPAVKQINLLYNINMLRQLSFLNEATPEWSAERDSWEQVNRLRLKNIFMQSADQLFADCLVYRGKLADMQNSKDTPKPLSNLKRFTRSDQSVKAKEFVEYMSNQRRTNFEHLNDLKLDLMEKHLVSTRKLIDQVFDQKTSYLFSYSIREHLYYLFLEVTEVCLSFRFLSFVLRASLTDSQIRNLLDGQIMMLEGHLGFCQNVLESIHLDSFSTRTVSLLDYYNRHKQYWKKYFQKEENLEFPFMCPMAVELLDTLVEVKNMDDYNIIKKSLDLITQKIDQMQGTIPSTWPQSLPNLSTHDGKPRLEVRNKKDYALILGEYSAYVNGLGHLKDSWVWTLRASYEFLDSLSPFSESPQDTTPFHEPAATMQSSFVKADEIKSPYSSPCTDEMLAPKTDTKGGKLQPNEVTEEPSKRKGHPRTTSIDISKQEEVKDTAEAPKAELPKLDRAQVRLQAEETKSTKNSSEVHGKKEKGDFILSGSIKLSKPGRVYGKIKTVEETFDKKIDGAEVDEKGNFMAPAPELKTHSKRDTVLDRVGGLKRKVGLNSPLYPNFQGSDSGTIVEPHQLGRSASSTNLLRELYTPKKDKIVVNISKGVKKVIPLTEEDVDNNVRGVIEKICVAKCWSIGDVVVRDEEGRLVELDRKLFSVSGNLFLTNLKEAKPLLNFKSMTTSDSSSFSDSSFLHSTRSKKLAPGVPNLVESLDLAAGSGSEISTSLSSQGLTSAPTSTYSSSPMLAELQPEEKKVKKGTLKLSVDKKKDKRRRSFGGKLAISSPRKAANAPSPGAAPLAEGTIYMRSEPIPLVPKRHASADQILTQAPSDGGDLYDEETSEDANVLKLECTNEKERKYILTFLQAMASRYPAESLGSALAQYIFEQTLSENSSSGTNSPAVGTIPLLSVSYSAPLNITRPALDQSDSLVVTTEGERTGTSSAETEVSSITENLDASKTSEMPVGKRAIASAQVGKSLSMPTASSFATKERNPKILTTTEGSPPQPTLHHRETTNKHNDTKDKEKDKEKSASTTDGSNSPPAGHLNKTVRNLAFNKQGRKRSNSHTGFAEHNNSIPSPNSSSRSPRSPRTPGSPGRHSQATPNNSGSTSSPNPAKRSGKGNGGHKNKT